MDENVLPFQSKTNDKNTAEDTSPTAIDDLKSTLNQRLKEKHDQERQDDIQTQKTTEKLISGLISTLSLGKKTSADLAAINEKNRLILKDNEQLTLKSEQFRDHNQQLLHKNTALQTKLDITDKSIRNLDDLSSDLNRAIRALEARCTKLAIQLGQSNAGLTQLRKDLSLQARTFKNVTHANHTLEKDNAALTEKLNLLKNIFSQGHTLLNPSVSETQRKTKHPRQSTAHPKKQKNTRS